MKGTEVSATPVPAISAILTAPVVSPALPVIYLGLVLSYRESYGPEVWQEVDVATAMGLGIRVDNCIRI